MPILKCRVDMNGHLLHILFQSNADGCIFVTTNFRVYLSLESTSEIVFSCIIYALH